MVRGNADLPVIRACIFDLDGLLINSEDMVTKAVNQVLKQYGRPPLDAPIRAKLMGVPDSTSSCEFHNWAKVPISREQFTLELKNRMREKFQNCIPLPGAERLLSNLSRVCNAFGDKIQLALASSTKSQSLELKISRPETKQLLNHFQRDRCILGDDPRVRQGKPAPDIYSVALQTLQSEINATPILPHECLVFEDSLAGFRAGFRAGMRVIWVPHPDLATEYQVSREGALTGGMGIISVGDDTGVREFDEDWVEKISSLAEFNYEKYGLHIQF
ncbi:hypothetical protein N7539_008499 [Penicillium diatomitis]|uniref:Uncharacterized protein n=1 Tax=Penicillium diatomitis TaxID=2819901 RepID=A0A9W9WQP9_9EURO|nr:uncharacterized protein N7539_008499 [Penicillium diatomitis]KAJ5471930.1 hypothetical protein N7539_008499 [Penicillium diatomitis]